VVEAPLMWSRQRFRGGSGTFIVAPLAAGVLIVLLIALVISGHGPEFRGVVHYSANGLVAVAPSDVARVEIRAGRDIVSLHRAAGGWAIDSEGGAVAVPAEIASHIDVGLRFLHVSAPLRDIPANEISATSFAAYGLDPPTSVVAIETGSGAAATVNFGVLNPVGTSQYVRIGGSPTVYLMPRHVGSEWQVAGDMARRLRAQGEPATAHRGHGLFLPVSMAQVWAVEIVAGGKLTRFERDSASNWFRHTGQHSHAANANVHLADPAQARIIDAALDAFDTTAVEARLGRAADAGQLVKFGLSFPPVIVLLYARDNPTEVARIEFGGAADSLDRYARLAPDGEVVTVAEFEVKRLTDLLKAVGAGS
jgi:Domain of unknown function (DUF4340)